MIVLSALSDEQYTYTFFKKNSSTVITRIRDGTRSLITIVYPGASFATELDISVCDGKSTELPYINPVRRIGSVLWRLRIILGPKQ